MTKTTDCACQSLDHVMPRIARVARDRAADAMGMSRSELKEEIMKVSNEIDRKVRSGARISLTDPLSVKLARLRRELNSASDHALDAVMPRIARVARDRVGSHDAGERGARAITQGDLDSAQRGLNMLRMSPSELDDLAKEHATKNMFASEVIEKAAKQLAAAKRRMGAGDHALDSMPNLARFRDARGAKA